MSNDVRAAIEAYRLKLAGGKRKKRPTLQEMRARSIKLAKKPARD